MGNLTPTIVIALIALFVALPGCINNGLALKDRWLPGKPMAEPVSPPRPTSWSLFIFNIIGTGLLVWLAYQAWPNQGQRQQDSLEQTKLAANESKKPPAPPRSKQTIKELLDESDALLDIVVKTGLPAAEEWRTSILAQNPEQICLGRDAAELRNQITLLADKLSATQKDTTVILEQNKIDQNELAPLLGWSFPSPQPSEFANAASSLNQYKGALQQFGDHPSCEVLITRANLPMTFSSLVRGFDSFSIWLANSRDRLTNYREVLRKELRGVP